MTEFQNPKSSVCTVVGPEYGEQYSPSHFASREPVTPKLQITCLVAKEDGKGMERKK